MFYEKLLALKVMSRSEVAALRGLRLSDIWDQLESEQEDAEERGIDLPEISGDPELSPPALAPANAGEGTGLSAVAVAKVGDPRKNGGDLFSALSSHRHGLD